jgi:hypothetical protein
MTDSKPAPKVERKAPSAKLGEVVRFVDHDGAEHPAVVHADSKDGLVDLVVLGGPAPAALQSDVPHADHLSEDEKARREAERRVHHDDSERPDLPEVEGQPAGTWRSL